MSKRLWEGLFVKQCSKCKEIKDISDFYRDQRKRDGRRTSCVKCDRSREDGERIKKWRYENREKLRLAAAKRYREKKHEIDAQSKRHITTPRGRAVQLTGTARTRAKQYNYEFNLTNEHIESIISSGHCEISGLPFDLKPRSDLMRNPFAPSIDRINNAGGYTIDNSHVVCGMFNSGKGEAVLIDFIAMCVAVAERHADDPKVIQRLKELRNAEF